MSKAWEEARRVARNIVVAEDVLIGWMIGPSFATKEQTVKSTRDCVVCDQIISALKAQA